MEILHPHCRTPLQLNKNDNELLSYCICNHTEIAISR